VSVRTDFSHKRLEGRGIAGNSAAQPFFSHGQSQFLLKHRSYGLRFEDRRQRDYHPRGRRHQLDAQKLDVADADGACVLCDRDDGDGLFAL